MTVALGNGFDLGPAAGAGRTGAAGNAAGLPRNAPVLAGASAGGSFLARWRQELAAMRSAGESDGEDGRESAGAPAMLETSGGDLPALAAGAGAAAGRPAASTNRPAESAGLAGAPASMRNREDKEDNIGASSDAPPPARPARSAESPESKQRPESREARTREGAHGAGKADAQSSISWPQFQAGASVAIAPLLLAQQQIPLPGPAASAGATQSPEGLRPGSGSSSAAAGPSVPAADGGSLSAEGRHSPVTGNHEAGLRNESLIGNGAEDGGPPLAFSSAANQGLPHTAQAEMETSRRQQAAAAQGSSGPGACSAAAAGGTADANHDAGSASRPGSNGSPSAGRNPGRSPGEASVTPGHEGGMGIAAAVGAAGGQAAAAHTAGAVEATPGANAAKGAEKSAEGAFAALDAQPNSAAVTWVHAGRDRAEAGFEDPALGWVAVRAEMGAGGVHAAIVPGTAEAAEALGGHLAGLSAHLAEQRVGVSALSMSSPNHPGNGPGNSPGIAPQLAGGGTEGNSGHSGAGRGQNQSQQQPAQTGEMRALARAPGILTTSAERESAQRGRIAAAGGITGRHISVVA